MRQRGVVNEDLNQVRLTEQGEEGGGHFEFY